MKRLVLVAILTAAAMAQPQPPVQQQSPVQQPPLQPGLSQSGEDDAGDAPDHGVARISYMNGNVSVRRGDSGDLVAAIMNAPLVLGDRLVTAEGARAEVQFDSANMIRLGPATEVRFSDLQYKRYQVQVAVGTVMFRVLRDSDAQVEISTPSVSARPVKKGMYRITVNPDGVSEISVRSGEAEIFSPRGAEQLRSGKTMVARGTASDPEFQVDGAIPQDDFDRWSANRDFVLERSNSYRYVSPDVSGAEELDNYGRWVNDSSYGNVWVPAVDPGWAPYRVGRWVWLDYYGWTWVSDDPWGWAPYHYGRWYQGVYGWSWYPGPVVAHYYWRPALVGFFGWGSPGIGIGFGSGFGHVGWVPLAPFERFHPWYGRGFSGGVGNNVTIVNNTNVTNIYRNARVNNGITSVRAGDFGRTDITNNNFVRPGAADLSRAGMLRGQLPLTPSRESTQFTNRQASTQGLPRTNNNTRFFSRNQAERNVNQTPQRSFTNNGVQPAPARNNTAAPGGNSGWQRFDPATGAARQNGPGSATPLNRQPVPQNTSPQSMSPQNNGGGWRRFEGGSQASQPQSRPDSRSDTPPQQPAYNNNRSYTPQQQPSNNNRSYTPPAQPSYQQPNYNRGYTPSQPAQPSYNRNYTPSQPRSYGSQQPVHINPPIVQNRGGGGGGGGGGRPSGGGGGGSRGGHH